MSRRVLSPVAKALHQFSPEVLRKARTMLNSEMALVTKDKEHPTRWFVRPDGMAGRTYTVNLVTNVKERWVMALCSCPNGRARGEEGKCYHKAAVLAKEWGEEL